jgi:hypothetical protein
LWSVLPMLVDMDLNSGNPFLNGFDNESDPVGLEMDAQLQMFRALSPGHFVATPQATVSQPSVTCSPQPPVSQPVVFAPQPTTEANNLNCW